MIQCKHHLGIEQLERLAVLFPAYQFLLLREFQWLRQLSCKLPRVQKIQISTCCCSVECLCRSKLQRQVKMKWLKHWTFLGKRKDHKSCIHLSAELNQLISKLVCTLSFTRPKGDFYLTFDFTCFMRKRLMTGALFLRINAFDKSRQNSKGSPSLAFSRIKMVLLRGLAILFMIVFCSVSYAETEFERKQKLLSLFSVVTFPNEYT